MVLDKVLNTIRQHNLISQGDSIVVGVSGGPDSVCLLHVLHRLADELSIKIYAVHINHMLRGSESEDDQEYVEQLCKTLSIHLHKKSYDILRISKEKKISLEEAGREARYREFESFAESVGASKIAVAHNKNDQAETVLLNIVRGAGLEGLRGMEYKRGNIIRPLLDVKREEIEAYCAENNLKPRTDSTNLKDIYTRNKIRLDIIPYISKKLDTDFVESICSMSEILREDNDFLQQAAYDAYKQCITLESRERVNLDVKKLISFHPALLARVIRHAIKHVKGDLKGIESIHVKSVKELAINGRTGAQIHLPENLRAEKSYNTLSIYCRDDQEVCSDFEAELKIPGKVCFDEEGFSITASLEETAGNSARYSKVPNSSYEQFFDYDKLKGGIYIRNRKNGDIFKPYGAKGSKKLKEYFIDNKIPRHLRDRIPLIAQGSNIVWIIGYKISDKFKVTENTKNVLKLVFEKNH